MKKFATILLITAAALVSLVALAFTIIEGRLVFAFDWTLHEHEFLGFIQYLARLGVSLLSLAIAVSSIVYHNRKSFVFEGAVLVSIAIAAMFHASNNFGIYFLILALFYLASSIFHNFAKD